MLLTEIVYSYVNQHKNERRKITNVILSSGQQAVKNKKR